jgi:hypothetical protein
MIRESQIRETLEQERKRPKTWWYISFVNRAGDVAGGKWLGASVLFDHGVLHAIEQSHRRGINRGGSFIGLKIPAHRVPPSEYHDRLLSEADVRNMWDDVVVLAAEEILRRTP